MEFLGILFCAAHSGVWLLGESCIGRWAVAIENTHIYFLYAPQNAMTILHSLFLVFTLSAPFYLEKFDSASCPAQILDNGASE